MMARAMWGQTKPSWPGFVAAGGADALLRAGAGVSVQVHRPGAGGASGGGHADDGGGDREVRELGGVGGRGVEAWGVAGGELLEDRDDAILAERLEAAFVHDADVGDALRVAELEQLDGALGTDAVAIDVDDAVALAWIEDARPMDVVGDVRGIAGSSACGGRLRLIQFGSASWGMVAFERGKVAKCRDRTMQAVQVDAARGNRSLTGGQPDGAVTLRQRRVVLANPILLLFRRQIGHRSR